MAAERSIVSRLRADISDAKAKLGQLKTEISSVGDATKKANQQSEQSSRQAAAAEKVRAAVRAQSVAQEIANSEKARISAEKYGKATSAVVRNKDTLNQVSRGFTLVGIAAAAGVGIAVKAAADFDQGMSNVAATGDDARANLAGLRKEAIQAGAATKFSATEAAGGIENLLKAGVSAKDTLGGGLSGALNLAAAGQISVADASETAATALTQFKLQGKDVPHVADLLAAGAGKAQGEVSDMAAALKQGGLVASQFGLSVEDTVGSLAAFASAGLIGSDAGTSFKTMLLALANPSVKSKQQMDQLGISAYDAQGKFVGITNLAGQLHDRLKDLPEAQRNAALAQIFGNDAIRAANVLYEQGAGGIQGWIDKVNDQGYAAETAATKMDNLKGDLEQFRGGLETALIGAGSGGTRALRELVQGATDVVSAFNELPEGAQHATLLGVAVVAAGALVVGAAIKMVTSLASARVALVELGIAGKLSSLTGLGAAFGAVAKAAGIATVALIAATAAAKGLDALDSYAAPSVDNVTGALDKLASTGSSLDLDKILSFKSNAIGSLGQEVTGVQGSLDALTRSGAKVDLAFDHFFGTTSGDAAKAEASFQSLDQAISGLGAGGHLGEAQTSFSKVAQEAQKANFPVADLIKLFPAYADQVRTAARANGIKITSDEQLIQLMSGVGVAAAQSGTAVATAAQQQKEAVDSVRASLQALADPTKLSADQSAQLAQSLFSEGNAAQSTVSAHSSLAAAVDAANKTFDKNAVYTNKSKTALLDNKAAGRENIEALNQLASAGKSYVQSLVAQGASADDAAKATEGIRKSFVAAAQDAGLNERAANRLADSYGLIPDKVSTEFDAFGIALQQQKVAEYLAAIQKLPEDQRTKIETIYRDKGAKAALAELNKINGTKSYPHILTQSDAQKVSRQATSLLQAIKDVDPQVKTGSNASKVSRDAQRYLNSIKGVDPKVLTRAELSAAREAKNLIDSINSKTVTIRTTRTSTNTVINQTITKKNQPTASARAYGGKHVGPGSDRSDNLLSWVSPNEWTIQAPSSRYYGDSIMAAINAGSIPKEAFAPYGFAYGGRAGLPGVASYASGGKIDYGAIQALIVALSNPLRDISNATGKVDQARANLRSEEAKISGPTRTLDTAKRRYDRARDRRQDLREEVADLKKRADATKGTTKADREYKKAQAELRDANNAVTRTSNEKRKAQEAYNKVADKAKAATQKLKDAQAELKQQQQELADATRQTSASFAGLYNQPGGDLAQWLDNMKTGAGDLTQFNRDIEALRKKGLNETSVQQIISLAQTSGVAAGEELVSQLNQGGAGGIQSLNAAAAALQSAADKLGFTTSKGITRRAGGGPIVGAGSGTSDDVLMWGSNGEFMQSEYAVRKYGLRFMSDVNTGRYQPNSSGISAAALQAAMAGMQVLVQNPWTGEYQRAQMRAVARDELSAQTTAARTGF